MRRISQIFLILIFLAAGTGEALAQKTVTGKTVYPPPAGAYKAVKLRSLPAGSIGCTAAEEGTFLLEQTTGLFKYCSDVSGSYDWEKLEGATGAGFWERTSGSPSFLSPLTSSDRVGIGTVNPEFSLTIENVSGILAKGQFGLGSALSASGEGRRLMWYPKKAAFRAGEVDRICSTSCHPCSCTGTGTGTASAKIVTGAVTGGGSAASATSGTGTCTCCSTTCTGGDQWNDANIGNYSVAMGYNTMASADYTAVSGGHTNTASAERAAVGGGRQNSATAKFAVVAGGYKNIASGTGSYVGGGNSNTASGNYSLVGGGKSNQATGESAVILGGFSNAAAGSNATIVGGKGNTASGNYSVIGGGLDNSALGLYSTVGGGHNNQATNDECFVGGGDSNTASGLYATVVGGKDNTASGTASVVGGGLANTASGDYSVVIGGSKNVASASHAVVAGGSGNSTAGDYSWVGGKNMILGPGADRTFLWGHAAAPITPINTQDAFIIYSGNVFIGTTPPNPLTYKLEVQGDINVTGDIISTSGTWTADYVFDSDYPLMTLAELKDFVSQNKHLPGVPSSEEIQKGRWGIFQQSKQLLEKTEEIYLYILELDKRLAQIEKELE